VAQKFELKMTWLFEGSKLVWVAVIAAKTDYQMSVKTAALGKLVIVAFSRVREKIHLSTSLFMLCFVRNHTLVNS
jgi:hypothetical protein